MSLPWHVANEAWQAIRRERARRQRAEQLADDLAVEQLPDPDPNNPNPDHEKESD